MNKHDYADELGLTPEMEDRYGPIMECEPPNYVIIQVSAGHPSGEIIVVENAPGLQAAVRDRRETREPQSLKVWLRRRGFNVLNAEPLAVAEEPTSSRVSRIEEREAERRELNRRVRGGETPADASDAISGGRCPVCGGFHEYGWRQCAEKPCDRRVVYFNGDGTAQVYRDGRGIRTYHISKQTRARLLRWCQLHGRRQGFVGCKSIGFGFNHIQESNHEAI